MRQQSRTVVVPLPEQTRPSSRPSGGRWTFPVEQRERILGAIIRVVAQQLAKPPEVEEVTHECS